MKESDIIYESGAYWVLRVPKGFEVYKNTSTHAERCAQIGASYGVQRAIAECEKRAKL